MEECKKRNQYHDVPNQQILENYYQRYLLVKDILQKIIDFAKYEPDSGKWESILEAQDRDTIATIMELFCVGDQELKRIEEIPIEERKNYTLFAWSNRYEEKDDREILLERLELKDSKLVAEFLERAVKALESKSYDNSDVL